MRYALDVVKHYIERVCSRINVSPPAITVNDEIVRSVSSLYGVSPPLPAIYWIRTGEIIFSSEALDTVENVCSTYAPAIREYLAELEKVAPPDWEQFPATAVLALPQEFARLIQTLCNIFAYSSLMIMHHVAVGIVQETDFYRWLRKVTDFFLQEVTTLLTTNPQLGKFMDEAGTNIIKSWAYLLFDSLRGLEGTIYLKLTEALNIAHRKGGEIVLPLADITIGIATGIPELAYRGVDLVVDTLDRWGGTREHLDGAKQGAKIVLDIAPKQLASYIRQIAEILQEAGYTELAQKVLALLTERAYGG